MKILQEAIAFTIVAPFTVLYMREPIKLDYLREDICLTEAVYFMFRSQSLK